jgi:hypothetical protein
MGGKRSWQLRTDWNVLKLQSQRMELYWFGDLHSKRELFTVTKKVPVTALVLHEVQPFALHGGLERPNVQISSLATRLSPARVPLQFLIYCVNLNSPRRLLLAL